MVSVNVIQTFTSIEMGTTDAAVLEGIPDQEGTQRQFNAAGLDQFDNWMIPQPTLFWSLDSGAVGSITSNGLYTAPTGGPPTSFTARVSGGGFSRTANVAVKPRADLIDFEGGGPYPGNGTDTVTYRDLTFTTSAGHLTVAPLQHYVGSPGPTAIFAGTLYHGIHNDWSSDRAGNITITFDSPRSLHSFDVVGRLVSGLCEETTSGHYSVGTLIIHPAVGDAVTRDLDVAGTLVEGQNDCENVGPHTSVDIYDTIYLTEYGPITSIEVIPNRIPFHDATQSDGPGGTAWCSHWIGEQEFAIDNMKFAPTLLELTVTDHANPNHATAIDAAMKELYVEEAPDHTGQIEILPVFDPMTFGENGAGKDVRVKVERSDGVSFLNIGLRDESAMLRLQEVTLVRYVDGPRDFTVTAWVDADHDENLTTGEQQLILDVYVVPEWTRNDWTQSVPKATAGIDGASLEELAEDVTGSAADALLLYHYGKITRGRELSVLPLIRQLDTKIRNCVVDAAGAHKYAHFTQGTNENRVAPVNWNEAQVNAVFTAGDQCIDCRGMALIVLARGLITTLEPGEFDRLWNTSTLQPYFLADRSVPSLRGTRLGDCVVFQNDERYSGGPMPYENTIKVGNDLYWGWGDNQGSTLSYAGWKQALIDEYNRDDRPGRVGKISDVPGYTRLATFFDPARVGMKVFDLRTGVDSTL